MSLMFGKVKTCSFAPERNPAECNLVLLGMIGAGKSALTVKFLTKRFISEYDPHLEDIYSSEENVDQQLVVVRVMDTCDQGGPANSGRYLSWASAFMVVYSIDNIESFKCCQQYLDTLSLHIKTIKTETPIVLLGNKLDMDRYRQVSKSDGEALASRYGCLFFEVSACLDFQSVQHVFHEAVRRARWDGERGFPPQDVCLGEGRATLGLSPAPSFITPCYKELPAPATAKLVTVKTSRAQSKRRAATLTLLKGFKIF